jgi:formylmethanofuran:tetrahydromethanopterin formyltransferase
LSLKVDATIWTLEAGTFCAKARFAEGSRVKVNRSADTEYWIRLLAVAPESTAVAVKDASERPTAVVGRPLSANVLLPRLPSETPSGRPVAVIDTTLLEEEVA